MNFDRLTKRFVASTPSRRGVIRFGLGGGLGLLGFGRVADEALACRKNGKPCGKGPNGGCCSGICKKGKCRPTPGAAGCTVNLDVCKKDEILRCPKNAEGICVTLDNGKPFCAAIGVCYQCDSNADCTALAGVAAKCVKTCTVCGPISSSRACFYGQQIM